MNTLIDNVKEHQKKNYIVGHVCISSPNQTKYEPLTIPVIINIFCLTADSTSKSMIYLNNQKYLKNSGHNTITAINDSTKFEKESRTNQLKKIKNN